jgi:hypothetical protein
MVYIAAGAELLGMPLLGEYRDEALSQFGPRNSSSSQFSQRMPVAQTPTFLHRSAAICRPTRRTFLAKPSTTLSRPMPETNGRRKSLTVRSGRP